MHADCSSPLIFNQIRQNRNQAESSIERAVNLCYKCRRSGIDVADKSLTREMEDKMKRLSLTLSILFLAALACPCFAQTTNANKNAAKPDAKPMSRAAVQSSLIAKEKSLWEAFKKKDPKPFERNLTADALQIDGTGLTTKADVVKSIPDCDVKDYSLSNFKTVKVDSNVMVLTYKATVHATCGGQAAPENIMAASVWVNRGGKWVASFHQETPQMK